VPGTVAVVIGGGSGHYPAFGGLVGEGVAHGAAMGNVFASPSADQAYQVAKSCAIGAGVLFSYGNYAGDVLNFDEAQRRLQAEGIDCRTVVVTDDISSAPPAEAGRRRGIAGDLVVFKIAGTAADSGADLGEIAAIAERANQRTRTIGVAFGGCTLPGAGAPLFTVPEGRMAVGLGVHGEPGIRETAMASADDLAELLVTSLLDEIPEGIPAAGCRVAPILNGLGAVKYEELFVLYRGVHTRLRAAGLQLVDPEVGELVTSFEMAGVSLTLAWLDEELERLWRAPADCAGYRKASTESAREEEQPAPATRDTEAVAAPRTARGSAASAAAGWHACQALAAAERVLGAHADELGRLDAVAGDGDHGLGMERGARAAWQAADQAASRGAGLRTVLLAAADAWADQAGGTSGALWGAALRAGGAEFSDETAPAAGNMLAAVTAAATAIQSRGHAAPGDRTMLDALIPLRDTFAARLEAGDAAATAWRHAAVAAGAAARETASLLPRAGRARTHAQRSLGTPDPGAISLALVADAVPCTAAAG
jgi:dihydroxyacetone kinase